MAFLPVSAFGSQRVFLYDLNVYKPPEEFQVNQPAVVKLWRETHRYSNDDIDFQERVFARSGLSPTLPCLPPSLNPAFVGNKHRTDLDSAMEECRMAVCSAVEGLLKKTGLGPADIDILVTTCSIYCPTPSMASMVVNAFGLRKDIQAYHLGGMGCANGVVAVNMVADLLKAHPNANALFVTTETTTPAYYRGNERHRLVTNLLFRMGAAAMLLTNKPSLAFGSGGGGGARGRPGAKYELLRRVRVHLGQSNDAHTAIFYGPDPEGLNGIYLGKNVVKEASRALATAMTKIAPHVLTWRQLGEAALDTVQRHMEGSRRRKALGTHPHSTVHPVSGADKTDRQHSHSHGHGHGHGHGQAGQEDHKHQHQLQPSDGKVPVSSSGAAAPSHGRPPYRPNFTQSTVRHFLLHAGGAKVLDGLGEALQLDSSRLAPSREVLHDYGNVSSSTTWYTLANVETTRGVKRGERVMQIGVGSGIKCGVNVWKALRDVREVHEAWAHRLTPAERQALQLERSVDVAHGWSHLAARALFAVLMVLLAMVMHWLMLQRAAVAVH